MNAKTKKRLGKVLGLVLLVGGFILLFFFLKKQKDQAEIGEASYSESIYVYNLTEDKVEFAFNEKERRPPASLTKIMTTYIVVEEVDNLSNPAPIDKQAYLESVEANSSMAGFYSYESTTYRDLLYGTMLASGGEAAKSMAVNLYGSEEAFVDRMNQEVENLGLENTHFTNPDGQDQKGQFSSAEDMGLLTKAALDNGHFQVLFTSPSYVSSPTLDHPEGLYIKSTVLSALEKYDYEGFEILGGKSGTTYEAGLCWVTLGKKNDQYYIVVVMGAPLGDLSDPTKGQILDTLEIMKNLWV